MTSKKRPPMKLEWVERCQDWVRVTRLPPGVSQVSAQAVLLALLRAAHSDGTQCLVAERWVERITGVPAWKVVRPFLDFLEEHGWLAKTGKWRNQTAVYRLLIPTESAGSVPAPDPLESAGGVPAPDGYRGYPPGDPGADTSHAPGAGSVPAFPAPKVQGKVQGEVQGVSLPPPNGVEGGVRRKGGAHSPEGNGAGSGSLSTTDLHRWRGDWELVATHRGLDLYALDTANRDLQAEFARLGAWDARQLHAALPRPRSVKTETGWFLAQLRRLPTDPTEHEGVVRASVLRLAHLHEQGDERDRLVALARRHGYIDSDGAWTALGLLLRQKVGDHHDEHDPLWALVEGAA